MRRPDVLEEARQAVTKDRQTTHGNPENTFALIAALWDAYLGSAIERTLTPTDVAHMMVLLKVARARGNPTHSDNHVDMAGYAACASELADGPWDRPAVTDHINLEGIDHA